MAAATCLVTRTARARHPRADVSAPRVRLPRAAPALRNRTLDVTQRVVTVRTVPTRAPRLTAGAFGVALFSVAISVSLVHMSAVRHERCEHGELIEVSPLHVDHARGAADTLYADAEGREVHEHCPLTIPAARHVTVPPAIGAALPAAGPGGDVVARAPDAPAARREVLAVAPKHGPPLLDA